MDSLRLPSTYVEGVKSGSSESVVVAAIHPPSQEDGMRGSRPAQERFSLSWKQQRYIAIRSFESAVPICWKVVTISEDEVRRKNLVASVAQFCSSVEVGSPPVSTWIM